MDAKGRKEGDRMNWESGTDIHTHTHTHTHTLYHVQNRQLVGTFYIAYRTDLSQHSVVT